MEQAQFLPSAERSSASEGTKRKGQSLDECHAWAGTWQRRLSLLVIVGFVSLCIALPYACCWPSAQAVPRLSY